VESKRKLALRGASVLPACCIHRFTMLCRKLVSPHQSALLVTVVTQVRVVLSRCRRPRGSTALMYASRNHQRLVYIYHTIPAVNLGGSSAIGLYRDACIACSVRRARYSDRNGFLTSMTSLARTRHTCSSCYSFVSSPLCKTSDTGKHCCSINDQ
jgi:hypothetical protein